MKVVALGDIVDFRSGGTPSKSNLEFWQGEIPWFSAKDLKRTRLTDSSDHISESAFEKLPLRKFPAGTVVMVVRGMILAHTVPISILEVEAAINQDLKVLIPKREFETSYLAAMLRAQHGTILASVSTAAHGTKKLDSRVLEELRVPFPPLDEQRRIAAILDRADALRAKRRQVLAHLDTLTQSIFHDMFGHLESDTELGAACTRITDGTHQSPRWEPEGVPFLFVSNITSGEITLNTQKFISDDTWSELTRRTPIEVGDILYSTVGSYGIPAVVRTDERFAFQRHIAHLKPDAEALLPDYLAAQLASPTLKRQAQRAARGIAQPTVNLGDINKFKIALPSLSLQRKFGARAGWVGRRRHEMRRSQVLNDELFASLQSRAFRGEL